MIKKDEEKRRDQENRIEKRGIGKGEGNSIVIEVVAKVVSPLNFFFISFTYLFYSIYCIEIYCGFL